MDGTGAAVTLDTEAARRGVLDALNAQTRRRLLVAGTAVVGRAELGPDRAVHLKLTLVNPWARRADVDALLDLVVAAGDEVSGGGPTTR
jgi:L-2,4-diaminobutyrate decarboxylase